MTDITAARGADGAYILEGKQIVRELDSLKYTLQWSFWPSVSSGGYEIYINGSSVTSDGEWNVADDTTSVSGNSAILGRFTIPSGLGGTTAVVEVAGTYEGETVKVAIVHTILKPGQTP